MKSVPKLIRRFIGILFLSIILLFIINFAFISALAVKQNSNGRPWKIAEEVANKLEITSNGDYVLDDYIANELKDSNAWAIFIENKTNSIKWQTNNAPDNLKNTYTLSDISNITRGYIDGCPTFTGERDDGIIVTGFPKDSYWKHMWPSWDYNFIANLPKTVISLFIVNIVLIFIIYIVTNSKIIKSIKPITNAIQDLGNGKNVRLKESGLLSEISLNINKTSEILENQRIELRKKETARANWIAGVSHDIRTPLSMIMGYASQLKNDNNISNDERKKADIIVKQSEKMKNLINDLNLASKLEYNMQPINKKEVNVVAILRQVVVDFLNIDIDNCYPIEWLIDDNLKVCNIKADKVLIYRAINNLIQNSINHNNNGCRIYVDLIEETNKCKIIVYDNGIGATDDEIEKLNNTPHYMVCDENATEQRHGLGLLIVKQIISAHNGTIEIKHSIYDGFCVEITLPTT